MQNKKVTKADYYVTYKSYTGRVQFKSGFAHITVDGKFAFRVKYPQAQTPNEYIQEFIDNKFFPEIRRQRLATEAQANQRRNARN
jgi:hypothetical protein